MIYAEATIDLHIIGIMSLSRLLAHLYKTAY
ncbi:protein of unknown function [Acidithiobacillus ferrivorans]|uniref:Uncharacterized protein n=1 Tax=Acidithiobacillus ferrivorans TaxID=160808 RepID=A0A060UWD6_9PROT|nr:hypothetical protein AFERRI_50018 [Acidithiobacillus ferrivorans]SMH64989.1 protein of unknown function [Acidithiobacillus ferrivorans]